MRHEVKDGSNLKVHGAAVVSSSRREASSRKPRRDPARIAREKKTLRRFMAVYCRAQHGKDRRGLCPACAGLERYAFARLDRCPYDPKPKCKRCPTHCYKPEYRAKIREVMRFSGIYFVKRGRLDWLIRYFM